MARNYPNQHKIVRTYTDPNAPTGEGQMYVTEDGTHWRRVLYRYSNDLGTGDRVGKISNNTIYEEDL